MRSTGTGPALRWAAGVGLGEARPGWGGGSLLGANWQRRDEALTGPPGGGWRGQGSAAAFSPVPRRLPAAGSHLQRGALTFHQLVQRAPQLPDRAPVSVGAGGQWEVGSGSWEGSWEGTRGWGLSLEATHFRCQHTLPTPSLFPRMPRHNYSRVAPLVKSLCAKHGLSYEVKPFLTALVDIVR